MSLVESPAMQAVFRYSKFRYLEKRFVRPSFLFDFRSISLDEVGGVFTPPVNHALPTSPFAIHVRSDTGGISLAPFQVEDNFPRGTAHVCGGIVIAIAGQDRLVYVSAEYPLRDPASNYLGDASTQYLLKTSLIDFDVVVEPIQAQHNGHPYVLENDRNGNPGLSLEGRNGLEVIDTGGRVLVRRM